MPPSLQLTPRFELQLYALALLAAVIPLWLTSLIPSVDLPQHLHLIAVLKDSANPSSSWHDIYAARPGFTPYLGYYAVVGFFARVLPLENANALFLSLCVVGLPLSLAFLLRCLRLDPFPSLLSLPFSFGDSFSWGFFNHLAGVPLALACLACIVRLIETDRHHFRWAVGIAACSAGTLLFHVQPFFFLAVAAPVILVVAPGKLRPRIWGALALLPSAIASLAWLIGRASTPANIRPGEPWHAWGPIFSKENLGFFPLEQNFDRYFYVLANAFRDGSDRWPLFVLVIIILLVVFFARVGREELRPRMILLTLTAVVTAMYFLLPFDVRGYVYYFNTRYAHLSAALFVCCVPFPSSRSRSVFVFAAFANALLLAAVHARAYRAWDDEVASLRTLESHVTRGAHVMGLLYNPSSRVMKHPVFLHAAAHLARVGEGVPNFSFALTPHSPVRYLQSPPRTFPSEWRPQDFELQTHGKDYDHFLLRGGSARTIFGSELDATFEQFQSGTFTLVARQRNGDRSEEGSGPTPAQ